MDILWIIRHEWTNYGLTYAMNGQIMEGVRHEWTNYGLILYAHEWTSTNYGLGIRHEWTNYGLGIRHEWTNYGRRTP